MDTTPDVFESCKYQEQSSIDLKNLDPCKDKKNVLLTQV